MDIKSNDVPNGGFPPIILCKPLTKEKDKQYLLKKRQFSIPKTVVSIKSILEKRRNIQPFIQKQE